MQIARQNRARKSFIEKYELDDYGENFENASLVRADIDEEGTKRKGK